MGTTRKLTDQMILDIQRRYESGESASSIAPDFRVAPMTITRALEMRGVAMRGRGSAIEESLLVQAESMLLGGASIDSIAVFCGVSSLAMGSALRRRGHATPKSGPARHAAGSVTAQGYRRVLIDDGDPMFAMGRKHPGSSRTRTILEHRHRLVLARKLRRLLQAHETVHHRDGDRLNNTPENLELRVGRHGKGATHAHCATCRCFENEG